MEHAEYTTGLLDDAMNLWLVPFNGHEFCIGWRWGEEVGDLLKLVIRQGTKLAVIGVAMELIASLALTMTMKSLLFDTSANDPLTFAAIAVLLMMVALLARWHCWLDGSQRGVRRRLIRWSLSATNDLLSCLLR
jgi:hypothetical protein